MRSLFVRFAAYCLAVVLLTSVAALGRTAEFMSGSYLTAQSPACISNLAARAKETKVQLTWTAMGGDVAVYRVYRSTVSGGPHSLIGSTTSSYSTYLDASNIAVGVTYYYVVRPALVSSEEICQSNQAAVTVTTRTPPGTSCVATLNPTSASLSAGASDGVINISIPAGCAWQASTTSAWISFPAGSTGMGNATFTFSVAANFSPTPRSGTILIAGTPFQVTQAGLVCNYSINPTSTIVPASGGQEAIFVHAPAGCPWTAVTEVPWISLTGGVSGTGSGQVSYNVAVNPAPAQRTGTLIIAGVQFVVFQAAALGQVPTCSVSGTPAVIRRTGLTELVGELVMNCANVPQSGVSADVLLTLNATVTSRLLNTSPATSEAFILLNNPGIPSLGTSAFQGNQTGLNIVLFKNVMITPGAGGMASLRFVNLRVSTAGMAALSSVSAAVSLQSSVLIPVANPQAVVATVLDPIVAGVVLEQVGSLDLDLFKATLTVKESFPSALRHGTSTPGTIDSASESGYTHLNFGPLVGTASTGTRIRAVYSEIPTGVSVYARVFPEGSEDVQLVSADSNGEGGVFLAGSAFGGSHVQLTPVNGIVTATWEVKAANAAAIEEHAFGFLLKGAIAAGMDPNSGTMNVSLAPVSNVGGSSVTAPIPRFIRGSPVSLGNLKIVPYLLP